MIRISGNVGYSFPARVILPKPEPTRIVVASERSRASGLVFHAGVRRTTRIRFMLSSIGKKDGFIPAISRANAGESPSVGGSICTGLRLSIGR